ncbi:iron-containing redox enzyme family protein [Streptomyces indicus]|nr:iron-containing redox enzyme family protein [Streptomyces indicus]
MDIDGTGPALPEARGELSSAVLTWLTSGADPRGERPALPTADQVRAADAYGEDLQLALYLCYELHYRGFRGVAAALEWHPDLLALRALLEERFLTALRADVPAADGDTASDGDAASDRNAVEEAIGELLVEPVHGNGLSHFLEQEGELWQVREYAAQRSLYHRKEADPHAWVLPRLWGKAKAGMAAVEFDEFGGGRAEQVHAELFADLMKDLGLDPAYGRYLDAANAEVLATVNLMSLFGLHRRLRGALVGHFASVEITSSPASRRLAHAMKRTGAGAAAEFFYTEHVVADAVHEQVVRREVVDGLLEAEPHLAADVVFGIRATTFVEGRFERRLLDAWKSGAGSLRTSL